MKDIYKEIKVFNYPNAIVRVHIPDLSEETRQKRMKEIHKAAGCLLRERTAK